MPHRHCSQGCRAFPRAPARVAASACTPSTVEMFAGMEKQEPPSFASSAAAWVALRRPCAPRRRPARPAQESPSAIILPMPREPPVTSAVRPLSENRSVIIGALPFPKPSLHAMSTSCSGRVPRKARAVARTTSARPLPSIYKIGFRSPGRGGVGFCSCKLATRQQKKPEQPLTAPPSHVSLI